MMSHEADEPTGPSDGAQQDRALWAATGPELQEILNALLSAFPAEHDLERMLAIHLDVRLANIAEPGTMPHRVFNVIEWMIGRGRLTELMLAAERANPDNPALRATMARARKQGLVPPSAPSPSAAEPTGGPPRTRRTPWLPIAAALVAVTGAVTAATVSKCAVTPSSSVTGLQPQNQPVVNQKKQESKTIPGTVVDVTGATHGGASVWVVELNQEPGKIAKKLAETTTDSSGNFTLTLPPATPPRVRVRASKPGIGEDSQDISVESLKVTLQLVKKDR